MKTHKFSCPTIFHQKSVIFSSFVSSDLFLFDCSWQNHPYCKGWSNTSESQPSAATCVQDAREWILSVCWERELCWCLKRNGWRGVGLNAAESIGRREEKTLPPGVLEGCGWGSLFFRGTNSEGPHFTKILLLGQIDPHKPPFHPVSGHFP